MPDETLPCELPGMNELMLAFDAALGPLAVGIELALDPDLALDATTDWAIANLDAALAMMVPSAALALAQIEVIKVAIDLPSLGAPFSIGFTLPGWGLPQIEALTGLLLDMIMIPINLMIGLFSLDITPDMSLCDIIRAGLPPIPGQDICVECIMARLGPIFGMGC
tara:strand:- start:148 stop:645 length:498 start_codon:yes stop_codon:yes gene_type:complete